MSTLISLRRPGGVCVEVHRDGDRYRVVQLKCSHRVLPLAQRCHPMVKKAQEYDNLDAAGALEALANCIRVPKKRGKRHDRQQR